MQKAAIYDPQFLSSAGIRIVLQESDEITEVVQLNTEKSLADQIKRHSPDLLVLEYLGEHPVSAETVKQLRQTHSQLKILVISEDEDAVEINRQIKSGVHGFLTKNCSVEEIQTALNTIKQDGRFYCQRVLDAISDNEFEQTLELSEREMQIIKFIGRGLSSSDIAKKLLVSIHTVNSHRKNILKKLGLKSPTELIIYAVDKGWLKPRK